MVPLQFAGEVALVHLVLGALAVARVECNHNVVLCALRGGRIKGVRRISLQNHIF